VEILKPNLNWINVYLFLFVVFSIFIKTDSMFWW